MSEENTEEKKPKSKNQIIADKVDFIIGREWKQTGTGNQRTDLVWSKDEQLANLESAYAMEKIRVNKENAKGSIPPGGDSRQGQKSIPPLTPEQKKELEKKEPADKKSVKK